MEGGIPVQVDVDTLMQDVQGLSPRGHSEWEGWKKNPNPQTMAGVLRAVRPTIDSTIKRYPGINPAIIGGEAKRLAIQAVKTYDPTQGASLPTHIFNHLRPLQRYSQTVTKAVNVPRNAREGYARYMGVKKDFFEENNREASDAELQDLLGINRKGLSKLHQLGHYEFAEGQLESMPDQPDEDDPVLDLWADYVYHDLNDRDKLIMDYRLGRNGQKVLSTQEIAAKLKIHPTYVNRRAEEIADRILKGVNSHAT